jgi:hypothetical protein
MAFSNIDNLQLGKFLQIAFSEGVRSQISNDYRDWEYVKRMRVSDPDGRELRFLFQKSYGPAAIQYRNPTGSTVFPSAQQITVSEHTAVFKEINATIELEYNLWDRARRSPSKYAEPLALEIQSKTIAAKRRLAADMYGDGTGVVAEVASEVSLASGVVTIQLSTSASSPGHVGFCEFGDLLVAATQAGVAILPSGAAAFYAYRVKERKRKLDQVVLEIVDSAGNVITGASATNLVSTAVFYRVGQPTIPNRTSISDYGTATEVMPGLQSLASSDGRTVHGIVMSGASAATSIDASGNPLDVSQVQELMDNVKINVGQSAYSWKMLAMAPEAHAALIESRETDRRFQSVEDNKRGVRIFAYVHGNDVLETYTSEYVQKKQMYALPEAKSGQKVLEAYMTDFEPVKMGGMGEFHLKPAASGGHERKISSYMQCLTTLICKHPAAIGRLSNFSL